MLKLLLLVNFEFAKVQAHHHLQKEKINWKDSTDAKLHAHSQLNVLATLQKLSLSRCAAKSFCPWATTAMGMLRPDTGMLNQRICITRLCY